MIREATGVGNNEPLKHESYGFNNHFPYYTIIFIPSFQYNIFITLASFFIDMY